MSDNDMPAGDETAEAALSREALLALSPLGFARFGVHRIAYVRPALIDGVPGVAIHAADGTPIGAAPNAVLAAAAIREHEMVPALLH